MEVPSRSFFHDLRPGPFERSLDRRHSLTKRRDGQYWTKKIAKLRVSILKYKSPRNAEEAVQSKKSMTEGLISFICVSGRPDYSARDQYSDIMCLERVIRSP